MNMLLQALPSVGPIENDDDDDDDDAHALMLSCSRVTWSSSARGSLLPSPLSDVALVLSCSDALVL